MTRRGYQNESMKRSDEGDIIEPSSLVHLLCGRLVEISVLLVCSGNIHAGISNGFRSFSNISTRHKPNKSCKVDHDEGRNRNGYHVPIRLRNSYRIFPGGSARTRSSYYYYCYLAAE